jgi:formate-dependent nitrite reductase membrane component NrfD
MHELTITRHNPAIDPTLHIWGWEISLYLFLGGLVAGMMIITGFFLSRHRFKEATCVCTLVPLLSVILLSIGMLALFLDLSHKVHVWRMYATFKPASPMSWGSWILLLVYPVLVGAFLVRPPEYLTKRLPALSRWSAQLHARPNRIRAIGILNMVLGVMLGIYTGILLSAFGARPLWNSPILALLFLISGLSTAAALVHLIARDRHESETLARADNAFLTAEMVSIVLFIVGFITSTKVHMQAAQLLLTGDYAPVFWVFVIGMGIMIPLSIQSLAVRHKLPHMPVAPIMVIVGGLILRFVIVEAGQVSSWARAALLP